MVAGANGAGKSTLIERLRALPDFHLPDLYINADDLQRRHSIGAPEAQKLAEHHRLQAMQNQQDVLYETVMSHPSKIAELQYAAAQGFTISIFYIGTNSPEINAARVALRVKAGLHDVPRDRIFARYARSMALAPSALAYADLAMVFDNSTLLAGQASLAQGELKLRVRQPEAWISKLQETVAARAEESRSFLGPAKDAGVSVRAAELSESRYEGPIAASGRYFALQLDRAGPVLHDKSLLADRVQDHMNYSIAYTDGVARVTRQVLER